MSLIGECPCGCDDCETNEIDTTAIRDWAERQKALGLIKVDGFEAVMRCAEDLEVGA